MVTAVSLTLFCEVGEDKKAFFWTTIANQTRTVNSTVNLDDTDKDKDSGGQGRQK